MCRRGTAHLRRLFLLLAAAEQINLLRLLLGRYCHRCCLGFLLRLLLRRRRRRLGCLLLLPLPGLVLPPLQLHVVQLQPDLQAGKRQAGTGRQAGTRYAHMSAHPYADILLA